MRPVFQLSQIDVGIGFKLQLRTHCGVIGYDKHLEFTEKKRASDFLSVMYSDESDREEARAFLTDYRKKQFRMEVKYGPYELARQGLTTFSSWDENTVRNLFVGAMREMAMDKLPSAAYSSHSEALEGYPVLHALFHYWTEFGSKGVDGQYQYKQRQLHRKEILRLTGVDIMGREPYKCED